MRSFRTYLHIYIVFPARRPAACTFKLNFPAVYAETHLNVLLSLVVTVCTNNFKLQSWHLVHAMYLFYMILTITINFLLNVKLMAFVVETCVPCEVRTGYLNII